MSFLKPRPKIVQRLVQKMKAAGKSHLKRPPVPPSIKGIERAYLSDILPMLAKMKWLIDQRLIPQIRMLVGHASSVRPKNDDYSDDLDRIMDGVKVEFFRDYSKKEIEFFAMKAAKRGNKFNSENFQRQFKAVLGVEIPLVEPYLDSTIKSFVKQNVSLIKSIPEQYFDRIEQTVLRDVQSGTLTEEIAEDVDDIYGVSESKATLIARDQTAKLNGNLAQMRQTEVGVYRYIWSTSLDERVRDSHAAKEGEIFSWDDPPADTGHPGEDINCVPDFASVSLHAPTKKAFRRWYDGELTEVISESSESLRVTPNHPVLTTRGWVPAHLLKIGDYLVEAPNQNGDLFIENPKRRDATAEEVFSSFRKFGLSHRVPGVASWFHGDSVGKNVDVVEINNRLLLAKYAATPNSFCKDRFARSPQTTFAHGHSSPSFVGLNRSSDGDISGSSQSLSLCEGGIFHSDKHRSAATANGNAAINQDTPYGRSTQIEFMSDSFLAHSVLIKPDDFRFRKVKAIVRRPWFGWVHNFETVTGWFSSVNLIVHNCRCVALPIFEEEQGEFAGNG